MITSDCHLVSVTLLFSTNAPPPTLAMDVERAVIAHVPHRLDGATWTGHSLGDGDADNADVPLPSWGHGTSPLYPAAAPESPTS